MHHVSRPVTHSIRTQGRKVGAGKSLTTYSYIAAFTLLNAVCISFATFAVQANGHQVSGGKVSSGRLSCMVVPGNVGTLGRCVQSLLKVLASLAQYRLAVGGRSPSEQSQATPGYQQAAYVI